MTGFMINVFLYNDSGNFKNNLPMYLLFYLTNIIEYILCASHYCSQQHYTTEEKRQTTLPLGPEILVGRQMINIIRNKLYGIA